MCVMSKIETIAAESSFSAFGYVEIDKLKFHQEIRAICEGNSCQNYATSWACPPAVGTIEECKMRVKRYDKMMLFSKLYYLEDSFDFEAMIAGLHDFKKAVDRFQQGLDGILSDYLLLSNEGYGRCSVCTYPDAPCRFPQCLHHSLEGYGFIVSDLAKEADIQYTNGANTVTYFGSLLFSI